MRQGMDELIEYLQINLEKDFGYDDDVAIDKLREVINELASNRLDHPGRPPPEELPQRPFGLIPVLTAEEEAGARTGLTDKEREFSAHTIQRQAENERASQLLDRSGASRSRLEEEDEEDDGEGGLQQRSFNFNWDVS